MSRFIAKQFKSDEEVVTVIGSAMIEPGDQLLPSTSSIWAICYLEGENGEIIPSSTIMQDQEYLELDARNLEKYDVVIPLMYEGLTPAGDDLDSASVVDMVIYRHEDRCIGTMTEEEFEKKFKLIGNLDFNDLDNFG